MCVNQSPRCLKIRNIAARLLGIAAVLIVAHASARADSRKDPSTILRFLSNSLEDPVHIASDPSNPARILIVERQGTVEVFDGRRIRYRSLLDIEELFEGEATYGLFAIQCVPRENNTPQTYYIAYKENHGDVIIARFSEKKDATAGEREVFGIMKIARLAPNTSQVSIATDRRGNLYVATGVSKPLASESEKTASLKPHHFDGTILRIRATPQTGYVIPKDNPCVDSKTVKPEIFTTNINNPIALWFDPKSNKILLADDSANSTAVYDITTATCGGSPDTSNSSLTIPHPPSSSPVIGAFRYRGKEFPDLRGRLIYGDRTTGTIYAAKLSTKPATKANDIIPLAHLTRGTLAALGQDGTGRIYVASSQGELWRLEPNS
jgi:glucose/arabinose dehydrogenase